MSKFKRKLVTCDPIMPDKVLEPYVDIVAEVNLVENSKFKHGPVLVKVVDGCRQARIVRCWVKSRNERNPCP